MGQGFMMEKTGVLLQIGTVIDILLAVVAIVYAIGVTGFLVFLIPSVWHGDSEPSMDNSRRLTVNERNLPVAATGFAFLFSGIILGILVKTIGTLSGLTRAIFRWIAIFGLFLLFVAIAINAFNRPKFLVPPSHREETGWVSEWWNE